MNLKMPLDEAKIISTYGVAWPRAFPQCVVGLGCFYVGIESLRILVISLGSTSVGILVAEFFS